MILRDIRNYLTILFSGTFDAHYYLRQYPDVRQADANPLWHFVKFGWREGRNPSSWFNTKFYLDANLDVKRVGMNPLIHYLRHGKFEGRLPAPAFNAGQETVNPEDGSYLQMAVSQSTTTEDSRASKKSLPGEGSENTWLDEEILEVLSEISY